MKLHRDLGDRNIKEVIEEYPPVGEILDRFNIGCIKCSVGSCLLKDVVAVHFLGDEIERVIEGEINLYLDSL